MSLVVFPAALHIKSFGSVSTRRTAASSCSAAIPANNIKYYVLIVCCGSKACSLGNYSKVEDHQQYIKDDKQVMSFKEKLLSYMAGPPQITLLWKFYLGKTLNLKLPWMHHSVRVREGSIGKTEVLSWSRKALYKYQSIYQGWNFKEK